MPPGDVFVTDKVSVDVPDPPLMDDGLKLAVTPEGNPPAVNATLLLKPFKGLTVTLQVTLLPAPTFSIHGVETEKSAVELFVG